MNPPRPIAGEPPTGFLDPDERALGEVFLRDGHVIVPVAERGALDRLRGHIVAAAARHLGDAMPGDPQRYLDGIHQRVSPGDLNALRLAVIGAVNAEAWTRRAYFDLARPYLDTLVGNELAMQRRLNLSIQMPDDASSLLPVHADVWDGDSPYEVVVWLPLVDCFATKSMFLLPPTAAAEIEAGFARFDGDGTEALFLAIEPDLTWLRLDYGQVLLFSQNLMHGNRINRESETRWTLNCRFKSLLSPYAGKRLGEFFAPITIRPATRVGMNHVFPTGFAE